MNLNQADRPTKCCWQKEQERFSPQCCRQFASDEAGSTITFSRLVRKIPRGWERWSGILPGFLLPTARPGHKLSLPPLPWARQLAVPTFQLFLQTLFPLLLLLIPILKKQPWCQATGSYCSTGQVKKGGGKDLWVIAAGWLCRAEGTASEERGPTDLNGTGRCCFMPHGRDVFPEELRLSPLSLFLTLLYTLNHSGW